MQYSSRRSSSPSGSERSDGSGGSDDSGRRSASSEESVTDRRHVSQQRSMAGVFHAYEPTSAPMPFNPERYPAYDAQARRIGLEHVRHESAPHDPSGRSYYRSRTYTYPPPREEPVYRPREEAHRHSRREHSPGYLPPRADSAYRQSRREPSPVYHPPREDSPVYIPPRDGSPVYHPPRADSPVYHPPRTESPVYYPPREHSPAYHPPREHSSVHRQPREEYVHRPSREEYRPPREDYEYRSRREDYLRRPLRDDDALRPPREDPPPRPPKEDYARRPPREEYVRRPPSPSHIPPYAPMVMDSPPGPIPRTPSSRYESRPAPQYDPRLVPPTPRREDRYAPPTSPERARVATEYTRPAEPYRPPVTEPMRQSPPPMPQAEPVYATDSPSEANAFGSPAPEEEVTLDMLVDPAYPDQKPNYPYPTLVKAAILSSPRRRLTLQEIYQALMDRFQWFKDNAKDKAWQVCTYFTSLFLYDADSHL